MEFVRFDICGRNVTKGIYGGIISDSFFVIRWTCFVLFVIRTFCSFIKLLRFYFNYYLVYLKLILVSRLKNKIEKSENFNKSILVGAGKKTNNGAHRYYK